MNFIPSGLFTLRCEKLMGRKIRKMVLVGSFKVQNMRVEYTFIQTSNSIIFLQKVFTIKTYKT